MNFVVHKSNTTWHNILKFFFNFHNTNQISIEVYKICGKKLTNSHGPITNKLKDRIISLEKLPIEYSGCARPRTMVKKFTKCIKLITHQILLISCMNLVQKKYNMKGKYILISKHISLSNKTILVVSPPAMEYCFRLWYS